MRKSFLIITFSFLTSSLWAQTINIKPAEVLKTIFQNSKTITAEKKTLTQEQQASLKRSLACDAIKPDWTFYVSKSDDKTDGYAVIDHELGKMEPITFLTAFNADGSIKAVEILVYREPYGSEVHEKRFMRQFEGKKKGAPLKVGQDIQNMSGATISSRSVTNGVKRDLAVWNIFYGK